VKLFVDDLTHVDFSYLDADRGLLGESWAVRLELDGTLNDEGMICDFGIVKKRVKQWFDDGIDHALAVATGMANLQIEQSNGCTQIRWTDTQGRLLSCKGPEQAFALLDIDAITPEAVASWCESRLVELFPDEVQGLKLTLYPETIDNALYHYSHGLQKHQGNCQRIAHGHRSRVLVFLNDERSAEQEAFWAEQFKDIYIGTQSHLVGEAAGISYFAYEAPQGKFELSLPSDRVYMIETESTVEQIAAHMAQVTARNCAGKKVEVRAFEGIGKGAIATA
jgi:6-pyruvoyl-tetrahydropterin synthase